MNEKKKIECRSVFVFFNGHYQIKKAEYTTCR